MVAFGLLATCFFFYSVLPGYPKDLYTEGCWVRGVQLVGCQWWRWWWVVVGRAQLWVDNISLTRCQCRLVGCTVSRLCFYKVLYIFNVFYKRVFPGASLHPLYVINLKKHIQQQQTIKAAKQKFTSLDNYIEQKSFQLREGWM